MSSSAQEAEQLISTTAAIDHVQAEVEPPSPSSPVKSAFSDSLFASYPLLRLSLPPSSSGQGFSLKADSRMGDQPEVSSLVPDLRPLREATLLKSIDPNSVLCRYEFPGGGICRDAQCEDVHLSKLSQDTNLAGPTDRDTAKYISSVVEGLAFDTIYQALQQISATTSLEERVAGALVSIRQLSSAGT